MERQLHISTSSLLRPDVVPVINSDSVRNKPKLGTGLWTSTYQPDNDYGSEWVYWCKHNSSSLPDPTLAVWWLMVPRADARIYTIDSYCDYEQLLQVYHHCPQNKITQILGTYTLDFEALSAIYDGIHLTAKGQQATYCTYPHSLWGWDCESTLWLQWAFDEVRTARYRTDLH